jgi:glycerol-3-phosphate acyltransferase PlsY
MKRGALPTRLTLIVVAALVLLATSLTSLPALPQSCALCYTQAASAGARMIQALRSGILILIVPPTLMSIGMIFIVYRKRNQVRETMGTAESGTIWNRARLSS